LIAVETIELGAEELLTGRIEDEEGHRLRLATENAQSV
jgi:hypothetical protein